MDLRPDEQPQLGKYRVVGSLGDGALGRVLLGEDPTGRRVAITVVRAELAAEPGFRERFREEVRAAAAAPPWFVAAVLDADTDGERPWLVTAFVDGPTLRTYIDEYGPLGDAGVSALAVRTADGLVALHDAGLVHRNLSPTTLILADDGPRLIGLGIARTADAGATVRTGHPVAPVEYLSPEQAGGGWPVGSASDMFSFGALLGHAATGRSPFAADTPARALIRVIEADPDLGAMQGPVRDVVAACLAKDPAQRPTASQVAGTLRSVEAAASAPTLVGPASRLPADHSSAGAPSTAPARDPGFPSVLGAPPSRPGVAGVPPRGGSLAPAASGAPDPAAFDPSPTPVGAPPVDPTAPADAPVSGDPATSDPSDLPSGSGERHPGEPFGRDPDSADVAPHPGEEPPRHSATPGDSTAAGQQPAWAPSSSGPAWPSPVGSGWGASGAAGWPAGSTGPAWSPPGASVGDEALGGPAPWGAGPGASAPSDAGPAGSASWGAGPGASALWDSGPGASAPWDAGPGGSGPWDARPAGRRAVPVVAIVLVGLLLGAGLAYVGFRGLTGLGTSTAARTSHAAAPSAGPDSPADTASRPAPTGPAAGTVAVDPATLGVAGPHFASPSRNITCLMAQTDGGSVRCDVAARNWQVPPPPSSCTAVWGPGAELDGSASGALTCAGDTVTDPSVAVLDYGRSVTYGNVVCVSRDTGVRCTNTTTEHGFRVSRATYELF